MNPQGNQFMDICRLGAVLLAVFIYVPFPGTLGSGVNCLARLAAPFCFAASGY